MIISTPKPEITNSITEQLVHSPPIACTSNWTAEMLSTAGVAAGLCKPSHAIGGAQLLK